MALFKMALSLYIVGSRLIEIEIDRQRGRSGVERDAHLIVFDFKFRSSFLNMDRALLSIVT